MLYNINMNVAKFATGGRRIRPDNFISVVSVMLAVAASASDIVVRASCCAGLLVYDMNGYDGLYIAAGAVTALGALYLAASVLVARTGRMGTLPMIFPACVIAVGLLLDMLFALLSRGRAYMCAEILLFVFGAAGAVALQFTAAGKVRPLITATALSVAAVVSAVAAFIAFFAGGATLVEAAGSLPPAAVICSMALVAAGMSDGVNGVTGGNDIG